MDDLIRTKICSTCQTAKPLNAFYRGRGKGMKMGWCKACHKTWTRDNYEKNKPRINAKHREWRKNNLDRYKELKRAQYYRRRNKSIEKHHGVPYGSIDKWMDAQKGACPVCLRLFGENVLPYVHHCHNTEYRYGLWCRECNFMEGAIKKIGDVDALLRLHKTINSFALFYHEGTNNRNA